jgi:hypothetical protein
LNSPRLYVSGAMAGYTSLWRVISVVDIWQELLASHCHGGQGFLYILEGAAREATAVVGDRRPSFINIAAPHLIFVPDIDLTDKVENPNLIIIIPVMAVKKVHITCIPCTV